MQRSFPPQVTQASPGEEKASIHMVPLQKLFKQLKSCSLLKETIFRRGLDADRGIGDIVHGYLASRRRMVFLLTTSACFKAVAAFFSTGHSLDTLVAQLVGSGFVPARLVRPMAPPSPIVVPFV